jgi:hypothetical protein
MSGPASPSISAAAGNRTVGDVGPRYPAVPEGQLQPPNPAHSWILGDVRTFSMIFGLVAGIALALAGIAFLTHQTWWPVAAIAAGLASLVPFAVFFTPWWTVGIAISTGLVIAAFRATPA